jgi:hypothetical protein
MAEFDPSQEFDPYGYYSPEQIAMFIEASKRNSPDLVGSKQRREANKREINTGAPNKLPQTLKNLGVSPKSDQQSNTFDWDKWGPLPVSTQSNWSGPGSKRKPITEDPDIRKFMDTPEFERGVSQKSIANLGFRGADRGGARVFKQPFDTNIWGKYWHKEERFSDDQLSTLMTGGSIGPFWPNKKKTRLGKYDRETFRDMGASEAASLRDSISVNISGDPNNDLNRTQTLHHEFRHRAISILREKSINIEKITGLREEDLLTTMDYMENKEGMWTLENEELDLVKRAKEFLKTEVDTITPKRRKKIEKRIEKIETKMKKLESWSKNPRVLAGIVQLQKAAMDAMAAFAKKLATSSKLGNELDAPGEGPGFQGPIPQEPIPQGPEDKVKQAQNFYRR